MLESNGKSGQGIQGNQDPVQPAGPTVKQAETHKINATFGSAFHCKRKSGRCAQSLVCMRECVCVWMCVCVCLIMSCF